MVRPALLFPSAGVLQRSQNNILNDEGNLQLEIINFLYKNLRKAECYRLC